MAWTPELPEGASGVSGWGGGLPASRVSSPHFTQKTPLTGAPHLLQKLSHGVFLSSTSTFRETCQAQEPVPPNLALAPGFL